MKEKVVLNKVGKSYELYAKKSDKLAALFPFSSNHAKCFYALRDISFTVFEGETIGIIGLNGSGKSTLSHLLAKIIQPTSGQVSIKGKTSLIAISAGLNGQLTGLENITLKCMMHGLSKSDIQKVTPDIIAFADIGNYIEQPVKDYSSGMKSRLGFAISVHTNPDILIIDEALSVGDSTFTQKCLNKMEEFKQEGKTIFFISHSVEQMRTFCDRVIWLHYGQLKKLDDASIVIDDYDAFTNSFNALSESEKKVYKDTRLKKQVSVMERAEEDGKASLSVNIISSMMTHSALALIVVCFALLIIFRT